jgi:diguanylate cyclase (GGDEF)-like protein
MAKWFYLSGSKITAASNEHYAVLIFTDITELKHQEKRMREQLILDLATGAMNKYSLVDSLQKLVQSDVPDQCFTICMIDFDNFKEINDLYGHLMGDMVLKVFSNIARRHIRKSDIFGRYGGEEFIFVFRETAHSQSLQIINRIHIELTKYFANKLKTPVTFSAGMIYVKNKECSFPEYTALLGDVDRFLYQAKVHGRSRVVSNIGEFLFGNL